MANAHERWCSPEKWLAHKPWCSLTIWLTLNADGALIQIGSLTNHGALGEHGYLHHTSFPAPPLSIFRVYVGCRGASIMEHMKDNFIRSIRRRVNRANRRLRRRGLPEITVAQVIKLLHDAAGRCTTSWCCREFGDRFKTRWVLWTFHGRPSVICRDCEMHLSSTMGTWDGPVITDEMWNAAA